MLLHAINLNKYQRSLIAEERKTNWGSLASLLETTNSSLDLPVHIDGGIFERQFTSHNWSVDEEMDWACWPVIGQLPLTRIRSVLGLINSSHTFYTNHLGSILWIRDLISAPPSTPHMESVHNHTQITRLVHYVYIMLQIFVNSGLWIFCFTLVNPLHFFVTQLTVVIRQWNPPAVTYHVSDTLMHGFSFFNKVLIIIAINTLPFDCVTWRSSTSVKLWQLSVLFFINHPACMWGGQATTDSASSAVRLDFPMRLQSVSIGRQTY